MGPSLMSGAVREHSTRKARSVSPSTDEPIYQIIDQVICLCVCGVATSVKYSRYLVQCHPVRHPPISREVREPLQQSLSQIVRECC